MHADIGLLDAVVEIGRIGRGFQHDALLDDAHRADPAGPVTTIAAREDGAVPGSAQTITSSSMTR